eukprot:410093_1
MATIFPLKHRFISFNFGSIRHLHPSQYNHPEENQASSPQSFQAHCFLANQHNLRHLWNTAPNVQTQIPTYDPNVSYPLMMGASPMLSPFSINSMNNYPVSVSTSPSHEHDESILSSSS